MGANSGYGGGKMGSGQMQPMNTSGTQGFNAPRSSFGGSNRFGQSNGYGGFNNASFNPRFNGQFMSGFPQMGGTPQMSGFGGGKMGNGQMQQMGGFNPFMFGLPAMSQMNQQNQFAQPMPLVKGSFPAGTGGIKSPSPQMLDDGSSPVAQYDTRFMKNANEVM